jgi:hypothetical protein
MSLATGGIQAAVLLVEARPASTAQDLSNLRRNNLKAADARSVQAAYADGTARLESKRSRSSDGVPGSA